MNEHKIITLCGSTIFKDEFIATSTRLTLNGIIVLSPTIFSKSEAIKLSEKQILDLETLHKSKIAMCDEVYVINKNGYIGEHTYMEIKYATDMGIKVSYLEPEVG